MVNKKKNFKQGKWIVILQRLINCSKCEKCFQNKAELLKHQIIHQETNDNVKLECSYCKKVFKNKRNLKSHTAVLHEKTSKYKCDQCEKLFISSRNLGKHKESHENIKYECKQCKKQLSSENSLKRHHKFYHEKGNRFKCDKCGMTFKSVEIFEHHQRSGKHENYKCPDCEKIYFQRSSFKNHMLFAHGPNNIKCLKCGKTFTTVGYLRVHIKNVHAENHSNNDLDVSGKVIKTEMKQEILNYFGNEHVTSLEIQSEKVNSLSIPSMDRNIHLCTRCNTTFEQSWDLNYHIATFKHLPRIKKKYPCEQCPKIFPKNRELERHTNAVHEDLRQDCKCDICGKWYTKLSSLENHIYIIHKTEINEIFVKCKFCDKTISKRNLSTHIKTVHEVHKHKCDKCDKIYSTTYLLNKHIKVVHKKSKTNAK